MTLLSNRTKWTMLVGAICMLAAGTAAAQTSCTNDDDCPTPECGGDVCDWSSTTAPMKCRPAGMSPKGQDGWCTTDDDCKCKALGATCVAAYCTFTRPCDAPGAAGCGSTGTGGSTGSGGSGATGTAGTSGGGGSNDSGGCSIATSTPPVASALFAAFGLLAFTRRRRR